MPSKVLEAIRGARLPQRGEAVVVGVSGGADSVALLHALLHVRRRLGLRLIVAHLHHGIRGRGADRDAAFVQSLAARRGLDCRVGHADVPALARVRRISIEMAAREARRAFLAETARSCGATAIALAHTADDQAETLLLRLARGAGRRGLGGMTEQSAAGGVRIVRPLLGCFRRDIERFLRAHRLAWREDESNRDPAHLRNRVRRRVIPLLERELNPSVRAALVRTAEVLGAEDQYLEERAARAARRCRRSGGGMDGVRLQRQPVALRRRVILRWLASGGLEGPEVDFDLVERIDRLLGRRKGTVSTPAARGRRVLMSYGVLRLARPAAAPPPPLPFRAPGAVSDPVRGLRVVAAAARGFVRRREAGPGRLPACAWLSADRLAGRTLTLRNARRGDRIRPMGMAGTMKVQDILVNARVPRDRRSAVLVVECDGEIAWLPGYRVAEGWQVPGPRARSVRLALAPIR